MKPSPRSSRRVSRAQQLLLALSVFALLMLRFSDWHWHRHLQPPCPGEACQLIVVQYLASDATPHLPADMDVDLSLTGDSATGEPLPALSDPLQLFGLLLFLGWLTQRRPAPAPPLPQPPPWRPHSPAAGLRPPLRAPPHLPLSA